MRKTHAWMLFCVPTRGETCAILPRKRRFWGLPKRAAVPGAQWSSGRLRVSLRCSHPAIGTKLLYCISHRDCSAEASAFGFFVLVMSILQRYFFVFVRFFQERTLNFRARGQAHRFKAQTIQVCDCSTLVSLSTLEPLYCL